MTVQLLKWNLECLFIIEQLLAVGKCELDKNLLPGPQLAYSTCLIGIDSFSGKEDAQKRHGLKFESHH